VVGRRAKTLGALYRQFTLSTWTAPDQVAGLSAAIRSTAVLERGGVESGELNARRIDILLVEDNPGDVRLTREALLEGKVPNQLNVVGDGIEALDYLFQRGVHANASRPDLVLLDLNLPKKDGGEVLAEIKAEASLKRIPVVVLTTSQADEDVLKSYNLHANCYIAKPVDFDQFIQIVRSIDAFWLTIVRLPME
jgi:chemotaxis family two-component system response regulator Rcp1